MQVDAWNTPLRQDASALGERRIGALDLLERPRAINRADDRNGVRPPFTYELTRAPEGATVDGATGKISWTAPFRRC